MSGDHERENKASRFVRVHKRYVPEHPLLQRIKADVRAVLVSSPERYWTWMPLYWSGKRALARAMLRLSGTPRDRFLDVDGLLWAAPEQIEDKARLKGSTLRNRGNGWVLDGDWDRLGHSFTRDKRYQAVRDVVTRGVAWQATEEYTGALTHFDKGETAWYCRTRDELDERCRALDRLIDGIRTNGYLTQEELRRRRSREGALGRGDEVTVAIGRHGDLLFCDGAHRLAIARELHLPVLPVQVMLRHSQWQGFRDEIARYADGHGGNVPQPLLHPDLACIPARGAWEGRYRRVADGLTAGASVIDMAPGWGYFSQRLEDEGFQCTAVEPAGSAVYFLDRLRRASRHRFAIVPADALLAVKTDGPRFESGLLLADGLGHDDRRPTADLLALVAAVQARVLLVEPTALVDGAARTDHARDLDKVLDALKTAGGFRRIDKVDAGPEGGPLLKLS